MSINLNKALKTYNEAREAFAATPDGEGADDLWTTVQNIAVEIVNELAELERPQVIEGGVTVEVSGGMVRAVYDANGANVAAEVHDYDTEGQDDEYLETDEYGAQYILTAP